MVGTSSSTTFSSVSSSSISSLCFSILSLKTLGILLGSSCLSLATILMWSGASQKAVGLIFFQLRCLLVYFHSHTNMSFSSRFWGFCLK